ncbi:TfoX/Sxy family protein [Bradyrhizobium amphicarpaeae]|uniref:Competence protein TfoX n=1 Tax=Bradyrhizobium amphicarpaeae TaxID=1404768 RepID=A0A2U8PTL2_9BRAD|nr:TfoX/Sxy family protein [Bradyrhizobium amphicarpaeae]AWM01084.1 competence protein TfoX [Bradyrhizobium amphicarpaeae]
MDREFLTDLFADFGPVTIRKMFSGYGISADGINFALALRAGLFFRADEMTIPDFETEGSKPFQYSTRAKTVVVNSYWELPARLFDDSEDFVQWARAALAAAQRAKVKTRPKGKKVAKKKVAPKKSLAKKAAKTTERRVGKATCPPEREERRRKRDHRSK